MELPEEKITSSEETFETFFTKLGIPLDFHLGTYEFDYAFKKGRFGEVAFEYAVKNGRVDVLKALREGSLLDLKTAMSAYWDGTTVKKGYRTMTVSHRAIDEAAYRGNAEVLRELREGYGFNHINARWNFNHPLNLASRQGHVDAVRELIEGYGLTKDDVLSYKLIKNSQFPVIVYFAEKFKFTKEEMYWVQRDFFLKKNPEDIETFKKIAALFGYSPEDIPFKCPI